MLTMALASLFLPFLPLTPVQILLNNMLYDLSQTGIAFDRAEGGDLATPRGWDMRGLVHFTLIMGPLSSLFDIATFAALIALVAATAAPPARNERQPLPRHGDRPAFPPVRAYVGFLRASAGHPHGDGSTGRRLPPLRRSAQAGGDAIRSLRRIRA